MRRQTQYTAKMASKTEIAVYDCGVALFVVDSLSDAVQKTTAHALASYPHQTPAFFKDIAEDNSLALRDCVGREWFSEEVAFYLESDFKSDVASV